MKRILKTFTGEVGHPDGSTQLLRRRLLSGRTVPIATEGSTWQALVAPAPTPTGGAKANPNHPSRKHDLERPAVKVTPSAHVEGPVPGQARRRARRAEARRLRKARPTGGGSCPCSGLTWFYTDEDREQWHEIHQFCPEFLADDEEVSA